MKEAAEFAILAQKWSKIAQQTPDTWGTVLLKELLVYIFIICFYFPIGEMRQNES